MMTILRTIRRFPLTIASLALLAIPVGCNSDDPVPPLTQVPYQPPVVADGLPTPVEKMPPDVVDQMAHKIDKNIQRTAGAVEGEIDKVKGAENQAADEAKGVKKAIGDAENEVKRDAKEVEAEARKAADKTLENLLGGPPK